MRQCHWVHLLKYLCNCANTVLHTLPMNSNHHRRFLKISSPFSWIFVYIHMVSAKIKYFRRPLYFPKMRDLLQKKWLQSVCLIFTSIAHVATFGDVVIQCGLLLGYDLRLFLSVNTTTKMMLFLLRTEVYRMRRLYGAKSAW